MTLAVADARALDRSASVPLVVLTLLDATVLYLSDRKTEYGGHTYEPLIVSAAAIEESVSRLDSTALAADYSLLLRNDLELAGFASLIVLHDTHQLDGARVDVSFLFADSGQVSTAVLLFSGVAEEPAEITRASFSLRCSGIPEHKAKSFALTKMESDAYILSLPSDSGKCFPELIGEFKHVECLRTRWPMFETDHYTTLTEDLDTSEANIDCTSTVGFGDDSDEEKAFWIDDERIEWGGKTTTPQRFQGCVRGTGGTTATTHTTGALIKEHPEDVATVELCKFPVHDVTSFQGEYGGLLAKVAPLTYKAGVNKTYATFSKQALVVPQTLLDTISFTGGGEPDWTDNASTQGAFSASCESTVSANRTWPANPYLNGGGVPQYNSLYLMVEWAITSCNGTDPSGTQHGAMPTFDATLSIVVNGVTYYLGRGWTQYYRTSGSPTYNYTVSKQKVETYMASVAAIPIPTLLDWGDTVACYFASDAHCNFSASITLKYRCLLNTNALAKTGTVRDEKYFRRIFANGYGRMAPDATTFYGTENTPITRPDYVMKQWIVNNLGFAEGDIDATTFDAAGTIYAAATPDYALSVRVSDDRIDALEELYRMAFECRSIVYFAAGKWYLKVTPDTAPASIKTISADDLAGEGAQFVGGFTRRRDVVNTVNLKWDKNDGPTKETDPYRKSKIVNAASAGDYQAQAEDLELRMVYGAAQALAVANIYLAQRCRVMRTISFPVFWDSTDLQLGDTITITGMGFWEGVKFWIDSVQREGINKATYTAVEWWA